MKRSTKKLIIMLIVCLIVILVDYYQDEVSKIYNKVMNVHIKSYNIDEIPKYSGENYVFINNNEPEFKEEDLNKESFEKYSHLDMLKRCGIAYANVSLDTMPIKKREPIGMVKPTGWQYTKYDIVENKYLYNRCHLIGYQLTGENANERNLITCTRQMNTIGMLPFENKVAEYIKKTSHHVLYRVSPMFEGRNLLATGVQMEAMSVEDKEIKFNVFVYNVQDGIEIDYGDGKSKLKNDN